MITYWQRRDRVRADVAEIVEFSSIIATAVAVIGSLAYLPDIVQFDPIGGTYFKAFCDATAGLGGLMNTFLTNVILVLAVHQGEPFNGGRFFRELGRFFRELGQIQAPQERDELLRSFEDSVEGNRSHHSNTRLPIFILSYIRLAISICGFTGLLGLAGFHFYQVFTNSSGQDSKQPNGKLAAIIHLLPAINGIVVGPIIWVLANRE